MRPGKKKPDKPVSRVGWTVGEPVTINSRNRNSHGWKGIVDGFSEQVPGKVRVLVAFERAGTPRIVMTFKPTELVVNR